MTLFERLDSFLKTPQLRRHILNCACILYWLWQTIWIILFMVQLIRSTSQELLFDFLPSMQGYSSSFLIRMALAVLSAGTVSVRSIGRGLLALRLQDLLFWILSAAAISGSRKSRTWKEVVFCYVCMLLSLGVVLVRGFAAGSMNTVLLLLKRGGWGICLLSLAALLILVADLWKNIRAALHLRFMEDH